METGKVIKLFDRQGEVWKSRKQYILVCCGVQSGKTYFGAVWARNKMIGQPDKNGLISAPTYKILQQSTLEKFFALFPELRMFYKEQKSVIELPEGGHIYVRSADQPLGIEGMTVHWGWLDEYGQAPRMAWTVCRSRVSVTGGPLLITTTPYSMNWLYEEVYLRWKKREDPDIDFYSWRSVDNPYFRAEHAEKEKRRLSPEEYKKRYEGEFTRMSGLVYEDCTQDLLVRWQKIIPVSVMAGVDFGFTSPTAIEVIKRDKDDHFWVVDEYYKSGKTQEEINREAQKLYQKHNIGYWYPDPAEPDRVKSMQQQGLRCVNWGKKKGDVNSGVNAVRELFREKRLHIFWNCKNLIDEIQSYHYPEEGQKDEPVKEKDHGCDAIRYVLSQFQDPERADTLGTERRRKSAKKPAEAFKVDIKKIIEDEQNFQGEESWKY